MFGLRNGLFLLESTPWERQEINYTRMKLRIFFPFF